jgi:predicted small lipoprotein YifL
MGVSHPSRLVGKIMKLKAIALLSVFAALAACGKDSPATAPKETPVAAVASNEALPSYDSQGVIASLDGQILTLDHEGASAAGLKPGRDGFKVYADVMAEAPLTPGARVSFAFKKTPQGLEIARLEARP